MSGPKRNPDRLNTIGIIVVGICGAVLVYVTIVALEAFYVNDTSEIQTMADYGGQDTGARSLRAEQTSRIGEYGTNPRPAPPKANEAARLQSYRVPIDIAMKLVVDGARTDPGALVPAVGRSDKSTVLPVFGRPKIIPPPAAAPAPAGGAPPAAGSGAAPGAAAGSGAGSGAGSAAGSGAGSGVAPGPGAATELPAAPRVPTGAGTGPSPVGGAGPLDKSGAAPKAGSGSAAPPKAGSGSAAPPKGNGK
jgi:hypothetical protein